MTNRCRSETTKAIRDIDREILNTLIKIRVVTEKITEKLSQRKGEGSYGKR